MAKDFLYQSSVATVSYFRRLRIFLTLPQPPVAPPLNPPVGIKTPAARAAPPGAPGPHTPPAQHTPSAARWLPPYRKCHLLDSQSPAQMALQRLPYAAHLTSSGTAQACSTRISPARRPQTARAHTASGPTFRTGRLGTLLENWQWLQRPGRTLKTQDPRSSSSPLRGDPGKHLLHRGFDKPLDSALASAEHHS